MKYATHMVKHKNIYLALEPTGITKIILEFLKIVSKFIHSATQRSSMVLKLAM